MDLSEWDSIALPENGPYHREFGPFEVMEVICLIINITQGIEMFFDDFNGNFYI